MRKLQNTMDKAILSAQNFVNTKVKGVGVIEIIIIAIIFIGVCVVFRDALKTFVENLMSTLTTKASEIWTTAP